MWATARSVASSRRRRFVCSASSLAPSSRTGRMVMICISGLESSQEENMQSSGWYPYVGHL